MAVELQTQVSALRRENDTLSRRLSMLERKFLNHTKEQRAHAERLSGESKNLLSLVKCQPAMQEFSMALTAPLPESAWGLALQEKKADEEAAVFSGQEIDFA